MKNVLLALGLTVCASPLHAQAKPAAAKSCAMPDTASEWYRTQRAWQRLDDKHDWTNDSLRTALLAGARAAGGKDIAYQIGGSLPETAAAPQGDTTAITSIRTLLREMASKRTWPTRAAVGAAGVRAAWIVSLGDSALSRMAMHRMMEAGPGEASPADVAVLEDRLRLENGRKQLYASQLRVSHTAGGAVLVEPAPTEDLAHVDMRREAASLPKLAQAICAVRAQVVRGR